jgi:alkanesulfonate monooxygenase SsuD/methylene tetrahydromethanopterin reductase-like flavin-dependent oxidoreductase (luciferase family)
MRFSVFLVGRSTAPEQDRFVMQSLIEHARQAEDRGFDAVFMPDHHFTGYAPMSSDPFVFAAYLAGQLKKIHFRHVGDHRPAAPPGALRRAR